MSQAGIVQVQHNGTSLSLPSHFPLTSLSLPSHFPLTSLSLPSHFPLTSLSLPSHFPLTSLSLPSHFPLTSLALPSHFPLTSLSLPSHGNVDGLYSRSGIPSSHLPELHGLERCLGVWGGVSLPLTSPLPVLPPVHLPSSPVDGLQSRSWHHIKLPIRAAWVVKWGTFPAHLPLTSPLPILLPVHLPSSPVDGLHSRSGIPSRCLSELHGSVYRERCRECEAKCLSLSLTPVHLPSSPVDGLHSRSGIPSDSLSELHGWWSEVPFPLTSLSLPIYPYSLPSTFPPTVDGLHSRSGIPSHRLSELHGSVYRESCRECGAGYVRPFDVTAARGSSAAVRARMSAGGGGGVKEENREVLVGEGRKRHEPGKASFELTQKSAQMSTGGGGNVKEENQEVLLVHFGERIDDEELRTAREASMGAHVALCLGSSFKVRLSGGGPFKVHLFLPLTALLPSPHEVPPASKLPRLSTHLVPPASKLPRLATHAVIINLQRTPLDRHASITIRARIDAVLPRLLHLLHLPLPAYNRHADPLLSLSSTPLHSITHAPRLPLFCTPPPSLLLKLSTQAAEEKGKEVNSDSPLKVRFSLQHHPWHAITRQCSRCYRGQHQAHSLLAQGNGDQGEEEEAES
ncbi:unnamed protein product [Closterium sp. Naga37s-1]|nr:unnamed protein product [Closterium sp. Naga37s-1]